jgi:hypothetical protein
MEPQSPPSTVDGLEVSRSPGGHVELVNDEDILSPHAQETVSRIASGVGVLLVIALFISNLRRASPAVVSSKQKGVSAKDALAAKLAQTAYGNEEQGT